MIISICCREMLSGEEEDAPEVHAMFQGVDMQNVKLVVAGDRIVAGEDGDVADTVELLLDEFDAVMCLGAQKWQSLAQR